MAAAWPLYKGGGGGEGGELTERVQLQKGGGGGGGRKGGMKPSAHYACMFSFFSFPFISFRFGLFTFVALGNRGSPREVISVTCESSWLLRHTIIYINYFFFFTYIFSLYIYGCALSISISISGKLHLSADATSRFPAPDEPIMISSAQRPLQATNHKATSKPSRIVSTAATDNLYVGICQSV